MAQTKIDKQLEHTIAVDLFPARLRKPVEVKAIKDGGVILGGYDPKGNTAHIPIADNAFARTIRLHESAHALFSKEAIAINDIPAQAIEDAKIHLMLPTTGQTRRDEVYTAVSDLRNARKLLSNSRYSYDKEKDKAIAGLTLIRSAGILSKDESSVKGLAKLESFANEFVPNGKKLLDQIITAIKAGEITKARNLADDFISPEPKPPSQSKAQAQGKGKPSKGNSGSKSESSGGSTDGGTSGGSGSGGKNKAKDKPEPKEEQESKQEDSKEEEPQDKPEDEQKDEQDSKEEEKEDSQEQEEEEPEEQEEQEEDYNSKRKPTRTLSTVKPGDLVKLIPMSARKEEAKVLKIAADIAEHTDKEDASVIIYDAGTVNDVHGMPDMYVHTLNPNVPRKVKGRGHLVPQSVEQGVKIRMNKLALASVNPNATRLFTKNRVGGTVLIDASGSMSLYDKDLYKIAEKIPAGQVAYYSGMCDSYYSKDHWRGDLVIYAKDGKIRRQNKSLPFVWSGNLVDYPAIKWLLNQPAPRYLISDWGFTGGSKLRKMAHRLCQSAVDSRQLVVVRNLDELMKVWNKIDGAKSTKSPYTEEFMDKYM